MKDRSREKGNIAGRALRDSLVILAILAVGAKGISVAVDREVVRISPSDIHEIHAAF